MLAVDDAPLRDRKEDVASENWHRIASGKGVLFLHSLRCLIGADAF